MLKLLLGIYTYRRNHLTFCGFLPFLRKYMRARRVFLFNWRLAKTKLNEIFSDIRK